ncbi:hypothetical protein PHLGIDRAFT_417129 [Phlebiopsis gigantea 11061_1 CR5-6]|uniref:Uncharacterized protein n=1 Tax=Phlebiopsis gigantea (strain 11061_1 CR5-6) TaxID=745531 RepID=A0A0C3PVF7_PHLG1|nr:hypothetical protein PHLGIDRAFT_417129 [Phlebiopsis gigantea 11061_1 CR5-6]
MSPANLLTDVKNTSRNGDKYLVEIPRGCSIHVFKTPSPPVYGQPGAMKPDHQNRTPSPGSKQLVYASRPDATRKPSFGRATDYFGDQVNDYDRRLQVDLTRTSKPQKPYSIYPGTIPDTYIYERSISSMSDLPGSPESSSSSDTESLDTPIERCSIRARSSVETLEATLYAPPNGQTSPGTTSPYSAFYSSAPLTNAGRPVVVPPLSLTSGKYSPADDDASTVVSERDQPRNARPTAIYAQGPAAAAPLVVPPPPSRRNSDERSSSSSSRAQAAPMLTRRESTQQGTRTTSPPRGSDADTSVRLPPGLQYTNVAPPMPRRSSTSPPATSGFTSQRSPTGEQPPLSRTVSNGADIHPPRRGVRWTENLICPSTVPRTERRRGWWNRRGDQLWTNDGRYKAVDPSQEYPPDLVNYPEPGAGWMNEEGVRIDLQHRLVPLRSALKRSKNSSGSITELVSSQ